MQTNAGGCDAAFDYDLSGDLRTRRHCFRNNWAVLPLVVGGAYSGKYDVVVAYSIVTLARLMKRNKSRAYERAEKFMRAGGVRGQQPAPRLPDISRETFEHTFTQIYDTMFETIRKNCFEAKNAFCGDIPIKHMLVFDNNSRPMTLVANLSKDKQATAKIRNKLSKAIHCY